jgi:hypothetical protein
MTKTPNTIIGVVIGFTIMSVLGLGFQQFFQQSQSPPPPPRRRRTIQTQNQQKRRRKHFREKMGGKFRPGLQGSGDQLRQKLLSNNKQGIWDDVPYDIMDPITRGVFEDPVIAHDGNIYSKKSMLDTISKRGGARGVFGVNMNGAKKKLSEQQIDKLKKTKQKIKKFIQEHQQQDDLGRYKRKENINKNKSSSK